MKTLRFDPRLTPLIGAVVLLCLPVILDLAISGPATPFRYFAADSFYYFTIARNLAQQGIPTFDQIHPTNGFHPLWQLLTGLFYKLSMIFNLPETTYLLLILYTAMLFVALGVALTGWAFIRAKGWLPTSFILAPVGLYALLLGPVWIYAVDFKGLNSRLEGPLPLYGTMWSFINGMESGLALFFFGLLALLFVWSPHISPGRAAALGFTASLLVLSRLDHIFMAGGLGLFLGINGFQNRTQRSRTSLLLFTLGLAGPIMIYLLINYAYMHRFMPVSAAAKSTFPMPTLENFYNLVLVLYQPFNDQRWLDKFYRIAQIVVPCLIVGIGGAILALQPKRPFRHFYDVTLRRLDPFDTFLLFTGIGVFCLAFYNFFFVEFYGPGHWYFPVSILCTTLVFISAVDRFSVTVPVQNRKLFLYSLVVLLIFLVLHRRPEYHQRFAEFYLEEAQQVRAYYQEHPPKIIEYDDGIVAFATGFPTLSGFGVALDQAAFEAWQQGRLVEFATEQGFDKMTSLVYINFSQVSPEDPAADEVLPENFEFSHDYTTPNNSFSIIQFYKKFPGAGVGESPDQ